MNEFLYTLLIIFVAFGASFILMNIRHIITGKEFRGSCASNNPLIKNELGECTMCGKNPEEECQMPDIEST